MIISSITIEKIKTHPVARSSMTTYMRHTLPRLYNQILKQTSFLDKFASDKKPISLYERLFCIENSLNDRPKCKMCKENYVNRFIKEKSCYSKWCSPSCQASDSECIQKGKETKKEKYGDENFNNTEQRKQTLIELAENDSHYWKRRVEKTKNTKLRNYGDENFNNSKKISQTLHEHESEDDSFWKKREEKSMQTKIKNGHSSKWNNRDKAKKTCLRNYGVECFFQSNEWKRMHDEIVENDPDFYAKQNEKRKLTIQSMPDFYDHRSQKTRNTCFDRYGVKSSLQLKTCRDGRIDADMKKKMKLLAECQYDEPLFSIDDLRSNYRDKNHKYKFKCKKCGKKFYAALKWAYADHHHCLRCFPRSRSRCEMQMLEYVTSIWKNPDEVIYNDRTLIAPYELDIAVVNESKTTAFEYTGLYWHSYDLDESNKMRQVDKLEKCVSKGIQLVTVFEDEWLLDPENVKGKMRKVLGISRRVSAACCETLIEEHKISLVEKNTGETLMCMRFSHSRLNIREEWEITSVHESLSTTVEDGLRILVDQFEKHFHPKSAVVFVDRRWSNGSEYETCGFKIVKMMRPQCWWFNTHDIHRIHEKMFISKTANEILNEKFIYSKEQMNKLKSLGWMRVYDCGKLKMTKAFVI